jgi:hypothetical protein
MVIIINKHADPISNSVAPKIGGYMQTQSWVVDERNYCIR